MADEKLIEVIADALTGEVIEVELSAERVAEIQTQSEQALQIKEAQEAVRASALAKLAALGLTEEEIAAL
ncbi:hypothetical protein UFOVP437_19 [uncultured Caudovirales phage]|uniref:Uncharacterized protein n=1 Tax=uncultured Caudovirales phage TaxID=2100421 RepID=A0A6J5MB03_9CAUD|nr:hypothetical protein UFOVP437_19 [uncultured Caudovirales phage]